MPRGDLEPSVEIQLPTRKRCVAATLRIASTASMEYTANLQGYYGSGYFWLGVMQTFPLRNMQGESHAFEIPSSYFLSSRGVARFFARCPGVQIEKVRRLFEFGNDVHVEFSLDGDRYQVWEPYGDNGRYWVGSAHHGQPPKTLDALISFVHTHWPGPFSAFRGWVLSRLGVSMGNG